MLPFFLFYFKFSCHHYSYCALCSIWTYGRYAVLKWFINVLRASQRPLSRILSLHKHKGKCLTICLQMGMHSTRDDGVEVIVKLRVLNLSTRYLIKCWYSIKYWISAIIITSGVRMYVIWNTEAAAELVCVQNMSIHKLCSSLLF